MSKSLLLAAAAAVLSTGAAYAQAPAASQSQPADAQAQIQAPAPDPAEVERAKTALVKVIGQLQAGAPDYTQMDERLGGIVKQQQPQMTPALAQFGKIETVEHVATENGLHKFKVKFEKGATNWGIAFDQTGKLSGLTIQPG